MLRVERAQWHDFAYLRDNQLRRAGHDGVVDPGAAVIDQVAPAVAAQSLEQGHIALDGMFQDIGLSVDDAGFLALRQSCAGGSPGVEAADTRSAGPYALGQRALGHQIELDLARAIQLVEDRAAFQAAGKRAHNLADAAGAHQLADDVVAHRGVVGDDGQTLDAQVQQGLHEVCRAARRAEAANQDDGVILDAGYGLGQ
ncbi:hypothetical protein D3C85_1379350 [compost metagenome]